MAALTGALVEAPASPAGQIGEGSAIQRVRSGQVLVALAVAALWLVGLVAVVAGLQPAVRVLALVTLVAWLGTAIVRPQEPVVLVAVLLVCSVAILLATHGTESAWPIASVWFDATAMVAGFGMASLWRAVGFVGVVAASSLCAWTWILMADAGVGGWRSAVAWTTACFAIGVAAAAAAGLVRAAARRLDAMTAATQAAITRGELTRAAQAEHFRATRLLHDTVVNTLSAISHGVPDERWPELRERCRQDLELIASAADGVMARDPVAAAGTRAAALGLTLRSTGSLADLSEVSDDVLDAASAAVGEALLNVVKHAGVTEAELVLEPTDAGVRMLVLDRGSGLTGPGSEQGGVRQSILRRCTAAGIAASVEPRIGGGTVVTLDLPRQSAALSRARLFGGAEGRLLALAGISALVVDMGLRVLLTLGLAPALGAALAWFLLVAALGCAAWFSRDRLRPPPITAAFVAVVSLPVVILLPQQTGPLAWMWWGTLAGITCMLLLVALNASGCWLGVAYASQMGGRMIVDPDGSLSLLMPGVVTMAVGVLACLWIRHRLLAMVAQEDAAARERDAVRQRRLLSYAAQLEELELLKRATDAAREPLVQIAAGAVAPSDPGVRARAGELAAYLRDVTRVPPAAGDLGRRILRLLVRGRRQGTRVSLQLDLQRQPAARVAEALCAYVDRLGTTLGTPQRLRLFSNGAGGCLTVMSDRTVLNAGAAAQLEAAGILVEVSRGDDEALVELSW